MINHRRRLIDRHGNADDPRRARRPTDQHPYAVAGDNNRFYFHPPHIVAVGVNRGEKVARRDGVDDSVVGSDTDDRDVVSTDLLESTHGGKLFGVAGAKHAGKCGWV